MWQCGVSCSHCSKSMAQSFLTSGKAGVRNSSKTLPIFKLSSTIKVISDE